MLAEVADKGERQMRPASAPASTDLHRPVFPIEGRMNRIVTLMNETRTARPWTTRRALIWAALLPLGPIVIAIATVLSALALMLYNASLGAPALVLTLLALLRR